MVRQGGKETGRQGDGDGLFSVRRLAILCSLSLVLIVQLGCGKPAPLPGVTYVATLILKGKDGKVTEEQPAERIQSATVNHEQELVHENRTFVVRVRKTEYSKATFDVTFPDQSIQRARVGNRQKKDILPKDQKVGVRIQVEEAR
jgi:hypothetical protein